MKKLNTLSIALLVLLFAAPAFASNSVFDNMIELENVELESIQARYAEADVQVPGATNIDYNLQDMAPINFNMDNLNSVETFLGNATQVTIELPETNIFIDSMKTETMFGTLTFSGIEVHMAAGTKITIF